MARQQNVGNLLIDISANVAGVKKDLDQVRREIDGFTRSVNNTFKALGATIGIGLSFGAVVSEVKSWISAAAEAETASAKLNTALRAHNIGPALSAYKSIAQSLQGVTQYSDEAIMAVMRLFTTMGVGPVQIEPATQAAIRLAQAFDVELSEAAKAVAQAMEGSTRALGKFIPQIKGAKAGSMDAAQVLDLVAKAVGEAGFQLDTFAKQSAAFKNSWSEVSEEMGSVFLPIAKDVLDILGQITHAMLAQSQGNTIAWLEKELRYAEERKRELEGLAQALPSGELGVAEALADEARKIDEINRKLRGLRWERDEILKQAQKTYTKPPSELDRKVIADQLKAQLDLTEKYNAAQRKLQKEAAEAYETSQKQIAVAEAKATTDEVKQIAERLAMEEDFAKKRSEIEERLYDDLEKAGYDTFEVQKRLLDERYQDYAVYIDDVVLLEKAKAAELDRLWRKQAQQHGSFVDGAIAAWRDYKDSALSAGKSAYDGVTRSLEMTQQVFEDTIYNTMKGRIKDLGDLWKQFCNDMVDEWIRTIAKIASQQIMKGAAGELGFPNIFGFPMSTTAAAPTAPASYASPWEAEQFAGAGAAGGANPYILAAIVAAAVADQATGGAASSYMQQLMSNKYLNLAFPFFNPPESFKAWKNFISNPGSFFGGGGGDEANKVAFGMNVGDLTQRTASPFGWLGLTKEAHFRGADLAGALQQWAEMDKELAKVLTSGEIAKIASVSWRSSTFHNFEGKDLQTATVERFRAMGAAIGDEFAGRFMTAFNGSVDDLPGYLEKLGIVDEVRDYLEKIGQVNPFENWADFTAEGLKSLDTLITEWQIKVGNLAQTAGETFKTAMEAALTAQAQGASAWGAFGASLKSSIAGAITEGLISGFMQSNLIQQALAPIFLGLNTALEQAFVDGIFNADVFRQLMAGPMEAANQAIAMLNPAFAELMKMINLYQDALAWPAESARVSGRNKDSILSLARGIFDPLRQIDLDLRNLPGELWSINLEGMRQLLGLILGGDQQSLSRQSGESWVPRQGWRKVHADEAILNPYEAETWRRGRSEALRIEVPIYLDRKVIAKAVVTDRDALEYLRKRLD